ncbi:MAG: 3-phosphoshikimate 1-carboxyvinyltransferase [Anaerorhabdus sp.]
MKIKISKGNTFNREIIIPPSKSLLHRSLICASLAEGESTIENIILSDDVVATINCLISLGAKIDVYENKIIVNGINGQRVTKKKIDCKESGSTLRFLIPIVSLYEKEMIIMGKKSLMSRPLDVYKKIYDEQSLEFDLKDDSLRVNGKLKFGKYIIDGGTSSQFISGLLFVLPLLSDDSSIEIINSFESKAYVDLTIDMLLKFNIKIEKIGINKFYIKGNQKYKSANIKVEGDFSQFAFFAVLASFKGPITCTGLNHSSLQADKKIIEILKNMGSDIESINNGYIINKSKLKPFKFDISECPDLGPILSVCASLIDGDSTLKNISRLRFKESDRVIAVKEELKKCGIDSFDDDQNYLIRGKGSWNVKEDLISHNDHRIAMALVIGALSNNVEVIIDSFEAINKSYPTFLIDLKIIYEEEH